MALIDTHHVVTDTWTHLPDGTDVPADGDVTVSLSRWCEHTDALRARAGRIGVRIEPDEDAETLEGKLDGLSLVAVTFPKFTDGRGYSSARLLRDRLGWKGELRAIGNVLPDQVFYMRRCGVDTFDLADGKDPAHALEALHALSVTYQAAADEPRPLFRRSARA